MNVDDELRVRDALETIASRSWWVCVWLFILCTHTCGLSDAVKELKALR